MRDEKRVERFLFHELLEDLLRHLVVLHAGVNLDAEFTATAAAFLRRVVEPLRIDLADEIAVARAAPWALEIQSAGDVPLTVLVLDAQRAGDGLREVADHL